MTQTFAAAVGTTHDQARSEVHRLVETRFVFHAWDHIKILGADGADFHLDTKALDVDMDNPSGNGTSSGIGYLKRLRLIPVTSTQKPVINNKEGFAVSNVAVGTIGADGQAGLGSGLSGSGKTNVSAAWHYAQEKITDMVYTFGRYGLVTLKALAAFDTNELNRCKTIFRVVTAGLSDKTLLEDMPEYFGDISPYLLDKKRANFPMTADDCIAAAAEGVLELDGRPIKLNEIDLNAAISVAADLKGSILGAHYAALDLDGNGILAKTREGIQTQQKRGYDKADMWLMNQFPSFPMDTELEKSNKQLLKAIGNESREDDVPAGLVPVADFEAALKTQNEQFEAQLKAQNEAFEQRLAALEQPKAA